MMISSRRRQTPVGFQRRLFTISQPRRSEANTRFAALAEYAAALVNAKPWLIAARAKNALPVVKTVAFPDAQLVLFHADLLNFAGFKYRFDDRKSEQALRDTLHERIHPAFDALLGEILPAMGQLVPPPNVLVASRFFTPTFLRTPDNKYDVIGLVGSLYFGERAPDAFRIADVMGHIGRYAFERIPSSMMEKLRSKVANALTQVLGPSVPVVQSQMDFGGGIWATLCRFTIAETRRAALQSLGFRIADATEQAGYSVMREGIQLGVPALLPRFRLALYPAKTGSTQIDLLITETGDLAHDVVTRWLAHAARS